MTRLQTLWTPEASPGCVECGEPMELRDVFTFQTKHVALLCMYHTCPKCGDEYAQSWTLAELLLRPTTDTPGGVQ